MQSMTEFYFVPTLFCPLSSLALHEECREGSSGSLDYFHLIQLILSYEGSNPQKLGEWSGLCDQEIREEEPSQLPANSVLALDQNTRTILINRDNDK